MPQTSRQQDTGVYGIDISIEHEIDGFIKGLAVEAWTCMHLWRAKGEQDSCEGESNKCPREAIKAPSSALAADSTAQA